MSKLKKYLTIVGLCIVIILSIIYICFALIAVQKNKISEVKPSVLTTEEKDQILRKLNEPSIGHPMSKDKVKEVLDDLHAQIPKEKLLTVDQKEALLKKLNQQ